MKSLLTILFILSSLILLGQSQTRDVLYLKNGSVIKGSILEMNPSGLKIQTADGSLFVYKMAEVLKMEKEAYAGQTTAQNTTSFESQYALENLFKEYLKENRPDLKFVAVSKLNGISREVYGQNIYEMEYELVLQAAKDIYVNEGVSALYGNFREDFSYKLIPAGTLAKIEKDKKIVFLGKLPFEETNTGWKARSFTNDNYKVVSSDYVTSATAKKEAAEKAKRIAELKKKLDWKTADITTINFITKHYKTENLPLFSYAHSQYSLQLATAYQIRNDVVSRIQNAIYSAIQSTNRHSEITQNDFSSSQNVRNVEFKITEVIFPFAETGYKCTIALSAHVKGAYKDPMIISFEDNILLTVKGSSYRSTMSKSQALDSALRNLEKRVQDFIYQQEPLSADFVKVVLDKRGKADKVIFKKPAKLVAIKRLKLEVINPNSIFVNNGAFDTSNKIGDCIFKGEVRGGEIICEINGSKNKKAFLKYVNSKEPLIAISK